MGKKYVDVRADACPNFLSNTIIYIICICILCPTTSVLLLKYDFECRTLNHKGASITAQYCGSCSKCGRKENNRALPSSLSATTIVDLM